MNKNKKKMLILYVAGMTVIPIFLSFFLDNSSMINLCVYSLLLYYALKWFNVEIKDNIKMINKNMLLPFLKYEFLFWVISVGVSSISHILVGMSKNQESINAISTRNFGISILVFGFAGAFVEEIIFRFILLNYFGRNSIYKGILLSSVLFGILHLEELSIIVFFPYFIAGICLGYIYYKENNFLVSFGVHSMYNFICLILIG